MITKYIGFPDHHIDIIVKDKKWHAALPQLTREMRSWCQMVLNERGTFCSVAVTVLLTNDRQVRALNNEFRGMDKATNVLSFPMLELHPTATQLESSEEPAMLGDIALALGTIAREAEAQGKPFAHHVAHLVVHGVLHLLGHDHMDEDEAEAMEALETDLLACINIPNPYKKRRAKRSSK